MRRTAARKRAIPAVAFRVEGSGFGFWVQGLGLQDGQSSQGKMNLGCT